MGCGGWDHVEGAVQPDPRGGGRERVEPVPWSRNPFPLKAREKVSSKLPKFNRFLDCFFFSLKAQRFWLFVVTLYLNYNKGVLGSSWSVLGSSPV